MRAAWWWVDRWQKSTAFKDLTLAEQGAYRNLLDELWLRDGALPNDERVLAKLCGDALEWPRIRDRVMAHFHLVDGVWRNETHDEVQAESSRRAAIQKRYRDRKRGHGVESHVVDNVIHNGGDNEPSRVISSPSPDPDPSNGLPSLRSGDIVLPPVVSVEASVQAPASPLVEIVASPDPNVAWSREACDEWIERFGGTAPGARIGRALKPLVHRHGWPGVRPAWRKYLGQTEAQYASAERFAATFGNWTGTAPDPAPRDIRSQTPGQFNLATLQRIQKRLEAKEAGRDLGQGRPAAGPVEARRVLPGEAE